MATIAITHMGLIGHMARDERLGAAMAAHGHTVHAWAPGRHRDALEATGAHFHAHEPLAVSDIRGGGAGFVASLAEATEWHLEALIEQLLDCRAELLVHDYSAPWGRAAAAFLGLPSIASYPLVPSLAPARVATQGGRQRPLVPAFPPGWQASVARARVSWAAVEHRWGLPPETSAVDNPRPYDWTVSLTLPEIAGAGNAPERWRFVGPLLDPGPRPRYDQARRRRPLVYVSFGTFFNFATELVQSVIEALADQPVDVLISTGRGPVRARDLGSLPDNVQVETFVAAREVLSRASVAISHCGGNSVHEALWAGVPLVCLPQAGDQFGWAGRMEELGVGRIADESATSIREATLELIADETVPRRARELAARVSDYDGSGEVARVVRDALDT